MLLVPNFVMAETTAWTLRKTVDGINVSTRPVSGSALNAIRAEAEFAVPLQVIVDLLLEIDNRPIWNSICREAKIIKTDAQHDGRQLAYFYYDMPWPVKDRDLVLEFTPEFTDGSAKISASVVSDVLEPIDKAVRVAQAWEEWQLTALSDETAKVSMTVFMDPNGPIPAWLINSMSVSQPLEVMAMLRELSATRYQQIKQKHVEN